MTSLVVHVVLLVVCLALAAIFAAIQTAYSSLTRGLAHKLADDEVRHGAAVADIADDPAPTVSTALFLRVVGETGLIVTLVSWMAGDGHWWRYVVGGATGLVVVFVVVSVGARTVGRQHTVGVALAAAPLMRVVSAMLFFVPKAMILLGNAITPGRGYRDGPFTSEDEVLEYVDRAEASRQIEADEKRMIHSVFDLGDTLVREVMVPRLDVVAIDENKTLRQAMSLALRSGFSRIPVVGPGGLDDVTGIMYLKDVVKRVYDKSAAQSAETIGSLARPVTWCPDSKPADDLLREMQAAHTHLVVVVDEFGGTAGVVTIEDLVEEIVGDIRDEYDTAPDPVTELGPGHVEVSSRLSLADLGDLFDLELDDDDVDSVGGILAKLLGAAPIPDATATWEGLELTAGRFAGRRRQLATVTVRVAPPEGETGTDPAPEGPR